MVISVVTYDPGCLRLSPGDVPMTAAAEILAWLKASKELPLGAPSLAPGPGVVAGWPICGVP